MTHSHDSHAGRGVPVASEWCEHMWYWCVSTFTSFACKLRFASLYSEWLIHMQWACSMWMMRMTSAGSEWCECMWMQAEVCLKAQVCWWMKPYATDLYPTDLTYALMNLCASFTVDESISNRPLKWTHSMWMIPYPTDFYSTDLWNGLIHLCPSFTVNESISNRPLMSPYIFMYIYICVYM